MNFKLLVIILLINVVNSVKQKAHVRTEDASKKHVLIKNKSSDDSKDATDNTQHVSTTIENVTHPIKTIKIKIPATEKPKPKVVLPTSVQRWAEIISEKLYKAENMVVRREILLKAFDNVKTETRRGSTIVEKMVTAMEELLERRAQAAENIMRHAEALAKKNDTPPATYIFDRSQNLDRLKPEVTVELGVEWEIPVNCSSLRKVSLENRTHFGKSIGIKLDISSVQIATEVFDCDPRVLHEVYWSEGLLYTFQQNYEQDAMMDFQYFCSAKGYLRHYPAASWQSMFKLTLAPDEEEDGVPGDVYDCRLRSWYVAASGAPRDILILLDATGSMTNSTNKVHSEQFTLALLSALTDDDQVNVLRFNQTIRSSIRCLEDKLVSANHINSAAMLSHIPEYWDWNMTKMENVLRRAVKLLDREEQRTDKPPACQQVIVLIADSLEENVTDLMRELDPSGRIRVFVIWLHDEFGLRDNSRANSDLLGCTRDGHAAELTTDADVTEQVMRILRVLERPLVAQRKKRLRVFSDVYAHLEDPRRSEYHWTQKENEEQAYRYKQLRLNKKKLLSPAQLYSDYMHQVSLDKFGQYYEGIDVDYRLQISVAVPVFEHSTSENITIKLFQAKERNSTRTYPVNRLLGVAGVDIPIEHLKLILPYHELGAGGSLFLIDHRGNIVVHDNFKPTFDGNVLKPGYRTVDILDLEQPSVDLTPRNYSQDWLEFRQALLIDQPKGSKTMFGKNIFDDGLRAMLEMREYHWKRVLDHYTAVVVLPKENTKRRAAWPGTFSQQLAADASKAFGAELSVHPDWLYCQHVDRHFDEPEFEVRHFIARRKEEPNFPMRKLKHLFSPIKPTIFEKTYQCNEVLMARLCHEALVTLPWAEYHQQPGSKQDCAACEFGSTTAFFASDSGLTRWQQYHATSAHAAPPSGGEWPRGPGESWYRRAVAAPDKLVVHAPVSPIRKMRNLDAKPPALGVRYQWLTAARVVGHPEKGIFGVAGFHFHPQHLDDLLRTITNFPCPDEEKEDCVPRCDGEEWSCVLVDEGGWIVGGQSQLSEEAPSAEHLARVYPHAMQALLDANVFKLHWIHDYQGVCFPPINRAGSLLVPPLLKALWHSVTLLIHISRGALSLITFLSYSASLSSETKAEREKRRWVLGRDYAREQYDTLYDERVLVNRTTFAACDRSRALYRLQATPKAMNALSRTPDPCRWPVTGAAVPGTNLLLLAVYTLCPPSRPVPDPLVNEPVIIDEPGETEEYSASKLACRRNRVTLPVRAPPTTCYPHNYTQEEGYRQCGPWIPDPEPGENSALAVKPLDVNTLITTAAFITACQHYF